MGIAVHSIMLHEYLHVMLGAILFLVSGLALCLPQLWKEAKLPLALAFAALGLRWLVPPFIDGTLFEMEWKYSRFLDALATICILESALRWTPWRQRAKAIRILAYAGLAVLLFLPLAHGLPLGMLAGAIFLYYGWVSSQSFSPSERQWHRSFAFIFLLSQTLIPEFHSWMGIPSQMLSLIHILQVGLLAFVAFSFPLLQSGSLDLKFTRVVSISFFLGLVVSMSSIGGMFWHTMSITKMDFQTNLLQRGKAIASTIPADWLDSLDEISIDPNRKEFSELRSLLLRIVETQSDLRYAYLLRPSPVAPFSFLLIEPRQYTGSGKRVAKFGDLYEEAPPEFNSSFSEALPKVIGPYQDSWGSFMTATIPLPYGSLNPKFLLGIDISSSEYVRQMGEARKLLFIVALLVFALLGFGWIIYLRAQIKNQRAILLWQNQAKQQEQLALFASKSFANFSDACRQASLLLCSIPEVSTVSVWLFEGSLFRCMNLYLRFKNSHEDGEILPIEDHLAFRNSLSRQRQTLTQSETSWTPQEDWQTLSPGTHSRLDTALFQEGAPIGFLRIETNLSHTQWPQTQVFTSSISDILTVALEREFRHKIAKDHADQSKFLATLLDSLPVAVMVKSGRDMRYIIWNRSAERFTKIPADTAMGSTDFDLFSHEIANEFSLQDLQVLEAGDTLTNPLVHLGVFDLSLTRIRIHESKQSNAILTLGVDITDRVIAEQELQDANHRLEGALQESEELGREARAANEAKSQFLATMSHEIRTPMNGALGMLRLLLDTKLDEEQREYAELACSSSESLLFIINEILDFSRIESGRMQLDNHPFEFQRMTQEIIRLFEAQVRERGIALHFESTQNIPESLIGDSTRYRQIMTNLIGNAIKFTPKGEVRVLVRPEPQVGNQIKFHFEIRDTGIGIPKDKQTLLFHPFSQADNTLVRRFGGTGLGLAISKHLVELMGGTMGFSSEPGQGSTFWFDLSFQAMASEPSSVISANTPQQLAKLHGRILVVDDNPINLKLMIKILERLGLQSQGAITGRHAIEVLSSGNYDLVLMDIQMPEMDGFEATRLIRKGDAGAQSKNLPIIALTAMIMSTDRARCLDAGMNDYLAKPVQVDQVRATLLQYLKPKSGSFEK
jgi:signal transduction histidine kinase/CheY-like chemotaxis protein